MKGDIKSIFGVFGTTVKMIFAILFFGFGVFLPGTYLYMWITRMITPVMNNGIRTLLSFPIMIIWYLLIAFIGFKYWQVCKRWFYTGHFHPEYDEQYFAKLHEKWIKKHGGPRTATKEWKTNLTKQINGKTLSKNYPVFNGVTNLHADPINYQTEIDISLMFHGNTPIKGDKIKVKFTAKSNIDMKALHISLADTTPQKLRKSGEEYRSEKRATKEVWFSNKFILSAILNYGPGMEEYSEHGEAQRKNIDSDYSENSDFNYSLYDKTICSTNIKKDIPFTVEKEITVSEDVYSSCAIILWNELYETEMEAYLY